MSTILGIESSCDDTSAAIIREEYLLANVISNQEVHKAYGGVVPELASRAHQQNIIPVVDQAIKQAGIHEDDIDAVAFTKGPGLLGSLMVGSSFAKGYARARNIPLIEVNHLKGHIMAHFIKRLDKELSHPRFPFLTLLVSGGHTQLVVVRDPFNMEIVGQTIDDAAGEAFDKCAKVIGFPYPGGPLIDKYAQSGDPHAFAFSKPRIPSLDYSFSGLKTGFLYFIRDHVKEDPEFINNNLNDICASLQKTIIDILMEKLFLAALQTGVKEIALAGGVAANNGLRQTMEAAAKKHKWNLYIPEFIFTTDNAAMIAMAGYYKYQKQVYASWNVQPSARLRLK